jgi:acetyl esterase/lipase
MPPQSLSTAPSCSQQGDGRHGGGTDLNDDARDIRRYGMHDVAGEAQQQHSAWGSNGEGLAGIAPALIVTAEYDRLRDEAEAYGRKLDAVGSLTEYLEVPAVDHGYNIMSAAPDAADVTRRIYARIAEHVARATSSGQP